MYITTVTFTIVHKTKTASHGILRHIERTLRVFATGRDLDNVSAMLIQKIQLASEH